MKLKYNTAWLRDANNPVLPPLPGSAYDSTCCMNPWAVVREDGRYDLYYAGADNEGRRRICLAEAGEDNIAAWERHGVQLSNGTPGSIDANWCVLPHIVDMVDSLRRLYYTANSGVGKGLSAFPGICVAESRDGGPWVKLDTGPLLARTKVEGDPDCQGIAGGSVLRVTDVDGRLQWRFYYTGCPTLGDDVFLDQQKRICLAVSDDGLHWIKRGAVMLRNPQHDYENIAVAGPVVRRLLDGTYQMWYSAIGTRWGYYSICYAESADGLTWNRGTHYGDNLQLGPRGSGWAANDWENKMVEYPSVVTREDGSYRLFYTGNGYGEGGIGTAVSTPLRATIDDNGAHLAASDGRGEWKLTFPSLDRQSAVRWLGPDPDGSLWFETTLPDGIAIRLRLVHQEDGLVVRVTVMNAADRVAREAALTAMLTPVRETTLPSDVIVNGRSARESESANAGDSQSVREGGCRWSPAPGDDVTIQEDGGLMHTFVFTGLDSGATVTAVALICIK
ncbi:glycoside hydrolase family protein [Paenibacillus cymbidii]|uniref:hypothetical protein n=1 Tax=Paenibacillus cymbidii TaxID=1639034 RepID=UPI0010802442|nr:hypothetical protein [Paenibacillus cymbidii]